MSYFRRPATTNEKRSYQDAIEFGVRVRGKRAVRNLPGTHEDLNKASNNYRNWKYYRSTQYK